MTGRVAVVGGGVAGLATAYHLLAAGADPIVFEAGDVAGGATAPPIDVGDLALEPGPDSLVARKPGVALCRDLGLRLTPPGTSGAMLWTDAGLVSYLSGTAFGIPGDVGDVLRWPGPSRGRFRALGDLLKRKRRGRRRGDPRGLLRAGSATRRPTSRSRRSWPASTPATSTACRPRRRSRAGRVGGGAGQPGARRAGRAAVARRADPGPMFLRPRRGMRELVDALVAPSASRPARGRRHRVDEGEVGLADAVERVDAVVLACGPPPPRRSSAPPRPSEPRRPNSPRSSSPPPPWCSSSIRRGPRTRSPTPAASSSRAGARR